MACAGAVKPGQRGHPFGGQHACMVADELGMETVFIHPFAGVLSAYGMGLADQAVMRHQAVEVPFRPDALPELVALAGRLADPAADELRRQGAEPARIRIARGLHIRYAGTEAALLVSLGPADQVVAEFTEAHRTRFGFATPERPLIAEAVAVEGTAAGDPVRDTQAAPRGAEDAVASNPIVRQGKLVPTQPILYNAFQQNTWIVPLVAPDTGKYQTLALVQAKNGRVVVGSTASASPQKDAFTQYAALLGIANAVPESDSGLKYCQGEVDRIAAAPGGSLYFTLRGSRRILSQASVWVRGVRPSACATAR